jgi:hypothetical protein
MRIRHLSFGPIAIACALIVAASTSTAQAQFREPLDIHNHHQPWGNNGQTLTYPSPTKIMNAVNGRPNRPTTRRVAQRTSPSRTSRSQAAQSNAAQSRTTRLNDLNLSVTTPPGHWVSTDPREIGSRTRYLISREDPAINISLAGVRVGPLANDTNVSLLAESREKMMAMPGGAVESGDRLISANHIDGIAYAATVTDGQFTTYYAIWVAAHNGYNYKLAVYGEKEDKAAIDAALRNFLHGMRPLDATRTARGSSHRGAVRR